MRAGVPLTDDDRRPWLDRVAQVLATEADPEVAARKLLAVALEAGGRDNVTVVVVRFDPVTAPSS